MCTSGRPGTVASSPSKEYVGSKVKRITLRAEGGPLHGVKGQTNNVARGAEGGPSLGTRAVHCIYIIHKPMFHT